MSDAIQAKVVLTIDKSSINKEVDATTRQLKTKLSSMGQEAGKAASSALSQNIGKIAGGIERTADKASKILEKGLKAGLGFGTASIVAFLKNGTAEAAKFQNRLDNLRSATGKVGEQLATKVDFGGGNTLADWINILTEKLNNLDTSKLQKIVDIGKVAVATWAGLKITQGVSGGIQAATNITSLIKGLAIGGAATGAGLGTAIGIEQIASTGVKTLIPGSLSSASTGAKAGAAAEGYLNKTMANAPKILARNAAMASASSLFGAIGLAWSGISVGLMSFQNESEKLKNTIGEGLNFTNTTSGIWTVLKDVFTGKFKKAAGLDKGTEMPNTPEAQQADAERLAAAKAKQASERIQLRQDQLIDGSFELRDKMRKFTTNQSNQAEQFVGDVPLQEQIKNLPDIANRIDDVNKLIDDLENQLKDSPKELKSTLSSLLDEAIGSRSTLISAGNSVLTSFIQQQDKKESAMEGRRGFAKQEKDLTDTFEESQKEVRPGRLVLGAQAQDIPNLIAESLNQNEADKVARDKELVEYNKRMKEIDEERLAFEKKVYEEDKKTKFTKEQWITILNTDTSSAGIIPVK